jgi:hypothetical protein
MYVSRNVRISRYNSVVSDMQLKTHEDDPAGSKHVGKGKVKLSPCLTN